MKCSNSRRRESSDCKGVNGTGYKIRAPCVYPTYICTCINLPTEYPSCQCTRDNHVTSPAPSIHPDTEQVTWKPLYVVSIGGGVFVIVLLTSVACCCLCRQWYSRRAGRVRDADKPPEYCDSPPPPYVHSSFYNTAPRPRTVQRGAFRIMSGGRARPLSGAAGPSRLRRVSNSEVDSASPMGQTGLIRHDSGIQPETFDDYQYRTDPNVERQTYLQNSSGGTQTVSEQRHHSDIILLPSVRNAQPDELHVVDVDS